MKKLLMITLILVVMISFVSAFEFDNTLTYDKNDKGRDDMKVTLHNAFNLPLFGSDLGTIELKSHSSPTEVLKFGYGAEEVVMYYDFTGWEEYKEGLGEVTFTDERTGKEVEKDYTFVYWGEVERDSYSAYECSEVNGREVCTNEVNGTETYETWLPLTGKDIPKEDIRIGLKTLVEQGDYIDAVWTIAGKKIDKHASWTAGLNTNLFAYHTFANTSDMVNSYDLVAVNSPVFNSTNCVIGDCGWVTDTNFWYIADNAAFDFAGTSEGAINFWIYRPTNSDGEILDKYAGGGNGYYFQFENTAGSIYEQSIANKRYSTEGNATDVWQMFTLSFNATSACFYVDATLASCETRQTTVAVNEHLGIGGRQDSVGTFDLEGIFDEMGFWSRDLSSAEVTQLYNGGAGITYTDSFPAYLNVELNEPVADATVYTLTNDYNCTAYDNLGITNVSLVIDGVVDSTNSSGINNTLYNFQSTQAIGTHNWTCWAYDSEDNLNNTAEVRNLTIVSGLTVATNAPVNAYNSTSQTLYFNGTASDNVAPLNLTLYINGTANQTNSSPTNNTMWSVSKTLADGYYTFYFGACDAISCSTSSSRNLTIDSTVPSVASNSSVTYEYQAINVGLPLYWTISDANLDKCFVEWYNNTNASITCATGSLLVNATASDDPRNLTFWANDTFGNYNSKYINWSYKIFKESETYTAHTVEGASNNFTLSIATNGSTVTIANLSYNNGQNLGVIGGTTSGYTIYKSVIAPTVTTDTNYTFFWNLSFSDGTYYAFDSLEQNVTNLAMDDCSTYTNVIYNFTLKDENTRTELNGSAINSVGGRVDIDLYSYGTTTQIANFSNLYNQTNPFAVCLSNALASGEDYNIDAQVQYFTDSYSTEIYNIQNETMNSTNLNQNISLYDLLTANAQVFEIIYKGSAYLPISNALIEVQRKYIDDGVFRTVEIPKTDAAGTAVTFLELNDVIYNFIIKKYGVVLATFTNVIPVCQTPTLTGCKIDFNSFSAGIDVPDYQANQDFNFTLTYDDTTRIVSSTFVIPSSSAQLVLLNVTREDALGTNICTDSLTTYAGTLSCTVPVNFGNATISAKLYKAGILQAQGQFKQDQDPSDIYGGVQIFLALFVMMTLIGAGMSDSPVLTTLFLAIGVILLFALNLVKSDGFIGVGATILWFIMVVIMMIIKGGGRRN